MTIGEKVSYLKGLIEGLDIDYPEDFTMAEIIAASRNLPK